MQNRPATGLARKCYLPTSSWLTRGIASEEDLDPGEAPDSSERLRFAWAALPVPDPEPTYSEIRLHRKSLREIARRFVFEAGVPGGPAYRHPLPRGKYLVASGPAELSAQEYDTQLDTDAAYDATTRSRGLGWIVRVHGDSEIREGWYDREGGGNNCAEISALVGGLIRARAEGRKRVLVRTDNRLASHILARVDRPQLQRVAELATRLWALLPSFQAVAVAWCPERELTAVDKLSKMMIRRSEGPSAAGVRGHFVERFGKGRALRGVEVPEYAQWMGWEERFP
jgi:ribonuclease HI